MIKGTVNSDGVPLIVLTIDGFPWTAVVDTGFNGDLEILESLRASFVLRSIGTIFSNLAAGQTIEEELYAITFPFDGELFEVEATFVISDTILIGTRLLRNHRLTIDFPAGSVLIEHTSKA